METRRRRDRRRHLPAVHLRPRRRPDRLHVQPVPRRRRRAAALPHRAARDVPARCRRRSPRVVPLERLRWITFGHLEADECGAMNQFLAAAPNAQVAHGALGCMVSINDLADRPPRTARARRGARPRRQAHPQHRHAARSARLGRPRALRGDHRHPVLRRPPVPGRRRPGAHQRRRRRRRRRRPRTCSARPASRRTPRPRSAASPSSNRRRSRSCTARRYNGDGGRRCSPSPTTTTAG